MTHKYERQCWNCKGKNIKKLSNHVKCFDCGATYNTIMESSRASHEVNLYETKTVGNKGSC